MISIYHIKHKASVSIGMHMAGKTLFLDGKLLEGKNKSPELSFQGFDSYFQSTSPAVILTIPPYYSWTLGLFLSLESTIPALFLLDKVLSHFKRPA